MKEKKDIKKKVAPKKKIAPKKKVATKKEKVPKKKVAAKKTKTTKVVKVEEKKVLKPSFLESKKILRLIFALLFLVLLFTLFNFFSLLKTREELKDYLEQAQRSDEMLISGDYSDLITPLEDVKKIIPAWRSFGDNFSSNAYLNLEKTDLFLDDVVTALTFPPLIEMEKINDSLVLASDDPTWILKGEKNSCQFAKANNCLELVNDKELSYNGRKIVLPQEMWNEEISRIDVSFLSSKYVISFSVLDGEQERAYAYFFNGRRYEALIGKNTETKIITEHARPGGVMVAGGDDDDFILFYSGYEGRAFHYREGNLKDISQFFGLRVTDGGFYPYIIKEGEGDNSLWYILNLSENKERLIKLWQNNSEEIKGAIDLSYVFKEFPALKVQAFRPALNTRAVLEFIFVSDEDSQSPQYLNNSGHWRFRDNGFDNSIDRQAQSVNINYSLGELNSAYFNDIFFNVDSNSLSSPAVLYLFSDKQELREVRPKEKISFPENSREIYWQIIFKAGNDFEYSPWFDHINDMRYYLTGK